MRTNKYYIDESFLRDNESIDQFFYLALLQQMTDFIEKSSN